MSRSDKLLENFKEAEKKYYSVGIDDNYTTKPVTLDFLHKKGIKTQQSRTAGDLQMFSDGKMVGWLFSSQPAQIAFLKKKGILSKKESYEALDPDLEKYLNFVKTEMKKISPLLKVTFPTTGYDKNRVSIKTTKQAPMGSDVAKQVEKFINEYKLYTADAYGTARGKLTVKDDTHKINISPNYGDGICKKLGLKEESITVEDVSGSSASDLGTIPTGTVKKKNKKESASEKFKRVIRGGKVVKKKVRPKGKKPKMSRSARLKLGRTLAHSPSAKAARRKPSTKRLRKKSIKIRQRKNL